MFLYDTEEDKLVETGLPLLESNFVKNTSVNHSNTIQLFFTRESDQSILDP